MVSMSSQDQNDLVSFEVFEAASALSLIALNDRPGGSISPFWAPPTVTSTPHSSWRESVEASDEMVATMNKGGWAARAIALRSSAARGRQPVAVSFWRAHPALIRCFLSSFG